MAPAWQGGSHWSCRYPPILGEDDLEISVICCPGERHIQLSARENQESKVNPDAFDGLALSFVDSDRECDTDWELTTFQFEGKVCVVFCQQERDARDELGLAGRGPIFTSIDTVINLRSERDEREY